MYLILTVHRLSNSNNNYRFGMSKADWQTIIPKLKGEDVFINLPGVRRSQVQAKTFLKYRNLINPTIINWINQNNYGHVRDQSPTKLVFHLRKNTLSYYSRQAH